MKVLITGSEGSLMQRVIPLLQGQGHSVIGIDNLYRYNRRRGNDYVFVNHDLLDCQQVDHLFSDVDLVIHAAAKIYGVGGFNRYCADILGDDIAITRNVLAASVKHKVKRFVYISSSMVYETCIQDLDVPVTEDMVIDCPMPKTDYGLSKLAGERLCQSYKKQYNLDYTIWRPFNIITPLETAEQEQGTSHVFADYIENILVKQLNPVPIIGDGNQIRCFTWIDDVASIIANYSFNPNTACEAYNICNVEPTSMKELAQKIYAYTNPSRDLEFKTTVDYPNDVRIRVPSVNKLHSLIGEYNWVPVDVSIARCIANANS